MAHLTLPANRLRPHSGLLGMLVVLLMVGWGRGLGSAEAGEGSTVGVEVSELNLAGEGYELPSTRVLAPKAGHCVVFFAGSGPTDRNWLSPMLPGKNGSAAQLANRLGEQGIGSIRFDKVGAGSNMKNLEILSLEHYGDEVILAFEHLLSTDRCTKVSLLGNSEGALHVLGAGVRLKDHARYGGVITMSGAGRSLLDTALGQIRDQYAAAGADLATLDPTFDAFRKAMVALPELPAATPDFSAVPSLGMFWAQATDPAQGKLVASLLQADPVVLAGAYPGPTLVMSAENDMQVPVSDGDLLFAALPTKQKTRVTVAAANHVFKTEPRAADPAKAAELVMAYAEEGRALAPGTVKAIVEFLKGLDGG